MGRTYVFRHNGDFFLLVDYYSMKNYRISCSRKEGREVMFALIAKTNSFCSYLDTFFFVGNGRDEFNSMFSKALNKQF